MTLSEAVGSYVERRRSEGAQFISTDFILRSFCKFCGNIDVGDLSTVHVTGFLNSSVRKAATIASNVSAIKCFADYCTARNLIAVLSLDAPSERRTRRRPYIYTLDELKALLDHARKRACPQASFDGETFRMILLVLYATGATFPEVLNLRRSTVDTQQSCISLDGKFGRSCRSIPIGTDLMRELIAFMKRTNEFILLSDLLFCGKNGKAIDRSNLWYCFSKLQQAAGFTKTASGHSPRLHDLRFTFAVHRLSYSIQRREKLNEIIPALSTYMGYTSLTKAEEYLSYVPERFNKDLRKLSPKKGTGHWRDESGLLGYLQSL